MAALVGLVVALAATGLHVHGDDPKAVPRLAASGSRTAEPPPPTGSSFVATPRATPVSLAVPAIEVSTSVIRLGLEEDGTVEVPDDPDDAGWYDQGPPPGERGSAVILGHVDSKTGPAVFSRLGDLSAGDLIAVTLSDRSIAHYRVNRVVEYANEDFPARAVYAGSPDRPALNLVTCSGDYDRTDGGYQSNLVVYSTYLWATEGRPAS